MKRILFLILAISVSTAHADFIFGGGGGGGGTWGSITGTLGDQTDLDTALDAKAPLANASPTGTWTFADGTTIGTDGITLQSGSGTGDRITLGTSTLATEIGFAGRVLFSLPSSGRFTIYENGQQIATLSADSMNWCAFAASRDCTFQWGMGKGTSHYGKGVALGYSTDTTVGNVTSGEDDLMSKSVQANALSSDGDRLEIRMWFTTGTGGTKTFKAYIGGTAAHTVTTTDDSATGMVECDYARTGASAGNYFCKSVIGTATGTSSGTLAVAHTGAIVVKGTGESADNTSDDIQQKMLTVKHMKVAN